MTAEEIKSRLQAKGITQGQLCRKWKKPKATVSMLVNRKLSSKPLDRRLARVLGITFEELRNGTEG